MLKNIKYGIQSEVFMDRATLALLTKSKERHDKHAPNDHVDIQDDDLDADRGHSIGGKLPDTRREYTVDSIECHFGDCDNVRYIVRWYGYAPADDIVERYENILEHCITPHERSVHKNVTVQ